jgi:ribulose-phosphate 3-epimerase
MSDGRRIKIAPSMLAADFTRLEEEIRKAEAGGAEWLHLDVMDAHFVPNLTFGPFVVAAIRKLTNLFLDTHLMITDPLEYAPKFVEAGSDLITYHCESVTDQAATIAQIRATGVQVGASIKPATGVQELMDILPSLDLVLIMSVEPGFGGQKFMPNALGKITTLRSEIDRQELGTLIQVDGGINPETAPLVRDAGVDVIVAGTAVFRAGDPAAAVATLRGE